MRDTRSSTGAHLRPRAQVLKAHPAVLDALLARQDFFPYNSGMSLAAGGAELLA